ncbi:hypothetical protein GCM10017673_30470 [Streptosporangium violaceochromogenes]|nr:hypothetical protein GCM10017673_30470 [Streptosporangium violaceochromogenes]
MSEPSEPTGAGPRRAGPGEGAPDAAWDAGGAWESREAGEVRDTRDAGDTGNIETAGDTGGAEGAGAEERIAGLRSEVADLEDRWRRALADLDNVRKRVARDAERTRAEERARAAAEWLPVLDNLDRALEHAGADPVPVVEGLRAIRDQAVEVLARLGFPRRDDTGAAFDPARHEAVGVLAREGTPGGTVVHVVQPAYGEGERQLRPALVVVSKAE